MLFPEDKGQDNGQALGQGEEEDPGTIIRVKKFEYKPMSSEDAIMQMNLLGHSFFVFINIETEQTNVLYLRKDGNLGLLDPGY